MKEVRSMLIQYEEFIEEVKEMRKIINEVSVSL